MTLIRPEVEHFRVTRDKHNKFFKYNGWPSVCRDDRGVLYAVASSMRMSHVCPAGKNCMYISYDGGKTWTKPFVINDSYCDDRDMGICYLGGGKLIVSWFTEAPANYNDQIQEYDWFKKKDQAISWGFSEAWKTLPPEVYAETAGAFVMMSDDYGVTWSDPVRVPLAAPHGMNVCADGTLVMLGNMLYNDSYSYKDEDGNEVRPPIACYISRDGGYHWEHQGDVPNGIADDGEEVTPWEMYEPHVCELPDGRLLGAIRVHSEHNKELSTTMICFSDDRGKTWSRPTGLGIDGMPPHVMVHSSGAIILSYSCRTNGARAEKAIVSYDGGATWTEDYVLDDTMVQDFCDMGYPATVELEDGSLVTVYYQEWKGEWWTSVIACKWRLNGK